MRTLIALTVIFIAVPAFARIGETESEIEARYGKVIESMKGQDGQGLMRHFHKFGEFTVAVTYLSGRSAMEFITTTSGRELTEDEVQQLLLANSSRGKWSVDGEEFNEKHWKNTAGDTAQLLHGKLLIGTEAYFEESAREKARNAIDKTKGF